MKIIIVLLVIFILLAGCQNKIVTDTNLLNLRSTCIEGHVYYYGGNSGGIAPKLDDNGKPIPCETEDYK